MKDAIIIMRAIIKSNFKYNLVRSAMTVPDQFTVENHSVLAVFFENIIVWRFVKNIMIWFLLFPVFINLVEDCNVEWTRKYMHNR